MSTFVVITAPVFAFLLLMVAWLLMLSDIQEYSKDNEEESK